MTELFFECPEADRRRIAPRSQVVGVDDRSDRQVHRTDCTRRRCMLKAVPRTLVLAMACLLAAGCASTSVSFLNAAPVRPLEVPATLYVPSGDGPFPALVLLHGCHGGWASTRQWGRWFKERGCVARGGDSWGAGGIKGDWWPVGPGG